MYTLHSPVTDLSPIALKIALRLKKVRIKTIWDLLYYFPIRYQDLRSVTTFADASHRPNTLLTIKGTVDTVKDIRTRSFQRLITECHVHDETGSAKVTWFNQRFLSRSLTPGDQLFLTGVWKLTPHGVVCTHPEYEKFKTTQDPTHAGRIVPFYPLTEGITQKMIRFLVTRALPVLTASKEYLPENIRTHFSLLPLKKALSIIHFPPDDKARIKAEYRLKFDELFILQLANWKRKQDLRAVHAPPIPFSKEKTKAYVDALPFALTEAQRKAAWDIIKDIEKNRPMNRLLEGDVGSGKTVVASIAILNAIRAGYQVAYMAPTEILAEQHFATFQKLFQNQNIPIALLTGSQAKIIQPKSFETAREDAFFSRERVGQLTSQREKSASRAKDQPLSTKAKDILNAIDSQKISLVIGTHSLIQDRISFPNLGLVVIDEQHRFGVKQRAALLKKYEIRNTKYEKSMPANKFPITAALIPHFLSMTATPIPRTLALTAYGDLDISILDEIPSNRKKIKTNFVPNEKRVELYTQIKKEIKNGRQAFVVCPIIDPSDILGAAAATEEAEMLKTKVFPEFSIGILHGRMNASQKTKVMRAFLNGELHILVATPVIEVGIDVPNATVMIIENAERFGLAQLHQIRGRVGRSDHQSYCFLLSNSPSIGTNERMRAFLTAQDGFELAEKDLEIRGPGNVLSTVQSGFEDTLYIARLTDYPIIREAQEAMQMIVPGLSKYPLLAQRVNEWEMTIHRE